MAAFRGRLSSGQGQRFPLPLLGSLRAMVCTCWEQSSVDQVVEEGSAENTAHSLEVWGSVLLALSF